ncbi:protein adenylyltransferase SelO [Algibacter sp. PT7-4]|uniref:protein adenylyltransferase SelO n=1 Tax=Algibacter ulvanivorans TaxID=3400999 RepID=UPI003AAF26B4
MNLNIKDKFSKKLPADTALDNTRRQVLNACFSYVTPKQTAKPELLHVSAEMLDSLGISSTEAKTSNFLGVFTGNKVLENSKPYAMCYGGHQFGNWAGQLGDGRAINLFEIEHKNTNWQVQLKGAGETPYSRTADGLAVLRSSVREYLCSEAMFHLGVPTTRALSLALTGDSVLRDIMYNGNQAYEKGAIVCRAAETFLRFGSFQIFASRQDNVTLKTLLDYTIKHHFPQLGAPSKKTYLAFFKEVTNRTLDMVIHWQRVGFVHGVMNTDNMSILGLTIDYGPYGWLEGYDYGWTPNTTDRQHKRYRFGNQANVGLWNLIQLANAIYPLIDEAEPLETILNEYKTNFEIKLLRMMRSKLGLFKEEEHDQKFILELEDILHLTETDMTIFFRNLASFDSQNPLKGLQVITDAFYKPEEVVGNIEKRWNNWFEKYAKRLGKESLSINDRKQKMNTINPKFVLRNYMAQLAIDDANKGNYKLINELFNMLKKPYAEQPENKKWFAKRPEWARHKVGCSMLSCSS